MAKLTTEQKERLKEVDEAIYHLMQVLVRPTGAPIKQLSPRQMEALRTDIMEAFHQARVVGCCPFEMDSYLDDIPHKDKRITCAEVSERDCPLAQCPFCVGK